MGKRSTLARICAATFEINMSGNCSSGENYLAVLDELAVHAEKHGKKPPELVCVSKTFDANAIQPVMDAGCRIFGENRVQEAQGKWPQLKKACPGIELHLIGPLQSNKAADAVALFDVVQTIDREKIARAIAAEMQKQGREPRLFVQVNTGSEPQKAGVLPTGAAGFVQFCQKELNLKISGLMCIPPVEENPGPHFALLRKLVGEASVSGLSMGMSADYLTALEFDATHVRVGSRIFGDR